MYLSCVLEFLTRQNLIFSRIQYSSFNITRDSEASGPNLSIRGHDVSAGLHYKQPAAHLIPPVHLTDQSLNSWKRTQASVWLKLKRNVAISDLR